MKTRTPFIKQDNLAIDLDMTAINATMSTPLFDATYQGDHCHLTIKNAIAPIQLKGKLSVGSIVIDGASSVTLNADLKSTSVSINATRDIFLEKKIDSSVLCLAADNMIQSNVRQSGQTVGELKAKTIVINNILEAEHLDIKADRLFAFGKIHAVSHANINARFISDAGMIVSGTQLDMHCTQLIASGNSRLIVKGDESSTIQANTLSLGGHATLEHVALTISDQLSIDGELSTSKNTLLTADKVDLQGSCAFQASNLHAGLFTTQPGSALSGSAGSNWKMGLLQVNGAFDFNQGTLSVESFSNHGSASIHHSSLTGNELISTTEFSTSYSNVDMKRLDFSGSYEFIKSNVNTDAMHQHECDGSFLQTSISANNLLLRGKNKLILDQSSIETSFAQLAGHVTLNASTWNGRAIEQKEGKLILKKRSHLRSAKTVVTAQDSQLSIQEKSTLDMSLANITGTLDVNNAHTKGKHILLDGPASFERSVMKASFLAVDRDLKRVSHSFFDVASMYVNSQMRVNEASKLHVDKTLQVMQDGVLGVSHSVIQADEGVSIFGEMALHDSRLQSQAISVYHDLDIVQSDVFLKGDARVTATGDLHLTDSRMNAEWFSFLNTLEVTHSVLQAKKTMDFMCGSKTSIHDAWLLAGESVNVSALSELHGEDLRLKTDSFYNQGLLDINKLHIDAEVFSNRFGDINGHESLQIIADKLFYNFLGSIQANECSINTAFSLNILGDLKGQDELHLHTFFDLNLYGAQRSFNAHLNSILGLNTGIVLPTIPSSLSAVFSPANIMNASKSVLVNVLPTFRNMINLAYFVAPIFWSVSRKLYDVSTDPAKSWRDLLPVIQDDEWRVTDYLSFLLALKVIAVAGKEVYEVAEEIPEEIEHCSFKKTWAEIENISPVHALYDAASAIGAHVENNTLFDVNMGCVASQNIERTALCGYHGGFTGAAQSLMNHTHFSKNHGLFAANCQALNDVLEPLEKHVNLHDIVNEVSHFLPHLESEHDSHEEKVYSL